MFSSRLGKLAISIACALFLSNLALAASFLQTGPHVFNYNFAEIKYLDVENADGFAIAGSADIRPNIALKVQYAALSEGRFDRDILRLGVSNYVGTAAYSQADWVFETGLDIADGDGDSDTGLYLSGGTRYAINDALEVNGTLEFSTVYDSELTIRLAALYEVSTGFAALVETEIGDESSIGVGVRFYWR